MSEKKKEGEQPLVFYYSRERRLATASEEVRRLNDPTSFRRIGLFRSLTANKGLAFLFLAIIMLSATVLVVNYLVPAADAAELKGNSLKLSAFAFEGTTYLALKKIPARKDAYSGAAKVHARLAGTDAFVLSEELVFGAAAEEFKYRIGTTGDRVEVVVEIEGAFAILRAKTQ